MKLFESKLLFLASRGHVAAALLATSLIGCSQVNKVKDTLRERQPARQLSLDKKWVRDTLSGEDYSFRSPHRMKTIIAKDFVIQGNAIDGIALYNRKTGHMGWKLSLKGGVEGGAILVGSSLYFGSNNGFFYSVDVEDGRIQWSFPIRSESLGAPVYDSNKIFFVSGNNRLYALDARSGKQLWVYSRRETSAISIRGGSKPAVDSRFVYAGFSDGAFVALRKSEGNLVWEKQLSSSNRFKDIDASPILDGSKVYVSSFEGGLYCLDKKNGSILWKRDEGGYSAVTLVGKELFYSTTEGRVVSLDKASGKQKWAYKPKKGLTTRPLAYKGLLVFGEYSGDLRVIDQRTGSALTRFSPGRGLLAEPAIDEKTGDVYFISVNANLFALRLNWVSNVENWPWGKL